MNATVLVTLSFRSILRNRMRSLLTTLGIIIGVCSVIVMIAVGEGSQKMIKDNISSMGTNLIIVMPPRGSMARQANRLTLQDVAKIRKEAINVSSVSGTIRVSARVVGGTSNWATTIYGVELPYLDIRQWEIGSGNFFSERESGARLKVAVLGTTVAKSLFGDADPIGERIRVLNTPFQVIGVLKSKGNNAMGSDQDDVVMVPIESALGRITKDKYISSIEMSAVSENVMDQAQEEITAIMRESHKLTDDKDSDFNVFNQSQIIEVASSTAKTLTILLAAIAGVSLLVGGIGIMNIMLVSVTERTREIGIRLSVGARKRDILLQFLTESVVLSLLGGIIGILIALGAVFAINTFTTQKAFVNPLFILISAGFAAAVGVFFGYYPAQKAANMNPIDALRTE